jgi:hypothetical protein
MTAEDTLTCIYPDNVFPLPDDQCVSSRYLHSIVSDLLYFCFLNSGASFQAVLTPCNFRQKESEPFEIIIQVLLGMLII